MLFVFVPLGASAQTAQTPSTAPLRPPVPRRCSGAECRAVRSGAEYRTVRSGAEYRAVRSGADSAPSAPQAPSTAPSGGAPSSAPSAQAPSTAASSDQILEPEELEGLVAPIALYADTLLSLMLMASAYPLEV